MTIAAKFKNRDANLPKYRDQLLENALKDLEIDADVLAIYLAGSLAKGDFDLYSDVDLHIIVTPEKKKSFIHDKRKRPQKWGEVLYFEDTSPKSQVIVVHYDCFVKVDTWYHEPNEVKKSFWLQGLQALYDPNDIVSKVIEQSNEMKYQPTATEVELWRTKIFAYIHEAYRSMLRGEIYDAQSMLDKFRWMVAYGWYMEKGIRVDSSWGVWSKLEGKRSHLDETQLSLLYAWESSLEPELMMETLSSMIPEFYRLNKALCEKTGHDEKRAWCEKVIGMVVE